MGHVCFWWERCTNMGRYPLASSMSRKIRALRRADAYQAVAPEGPKVA